MEQAQAAVHVIDDDADIRDSLQTLFASVSLNSHFYDSAEAFLDAWRPDSCGCVLADLRMPGMSGLELQEALDGRERQMPLIFLTGHPSTGAAVRAMREGAADFLTKPVDDDELIARVREALQKDQAQLQQQLQKKALTRRIDALTPREVEVLQGVVAGLSNKRIARKLGISYKTVELHRGHMMEKMQAHSIAEVVQFYTILYPSSPQTLIGAPES